MDNKDLLERALDKIHDIGENMGSSAGRKVSWIASMAVLTLALVVVGAAVLIRAFGRGYKKVT